MQRFEALICRVFNGCQEFKVQLSTRIPKISEQLLFTHEKGENRPIEVLIRLDLYDLKMNEVNEFDVSYKKYLVPFIVY